MTIKQWFCCRSAGYFVFQYDITCIITVNLGETMVKGKITVKQIDNTWGKISDPASVTDFIGYTKEGWYTGSKGKVKTEKFISMVNPITGNFPIGLLSRVVEVLKRRKYKYHIEVLDTFLAQKDYNIRGITLESTVQDVAVKIMLQHTRGVLVAPTGVGKTIMGSCILKAMDGNCLFVVHTKALYQQTVKRFKQYFTAKWVGEINPNKFEINKYTVAMKGILSSMIQDGSLSKSVKFNCIMGDEIHHASDVAGEYAVIYRYFNPAFKYGLTGSKPYILKNMLAMEAIVGPILKDITYEEAQTAGLVAKPTVVLIETKQMDMGRFFNKTYAQVYDAGIVNNRSRNLLICKEAKQKVIIGESVLILVEKIEHGKKLKKMMEILIKKRIVFISGEIKKINYLERQRLRLINKDILCVIATRVWVEGIDIPTLDNVINAVGGESEIACLQRFGRGTRITKSKKNVTLIDIVDYSHKWFVKHSLKRILTYYKTGWLG
jgi:superfamily II DNA or RNA helicase